MADNVLGLYFEIAADPKNAQKALDDFRSSAANVLGLTEANFNRFAAGVEKNWGLAQGSRRWRCSVGYPRGQRRFTGTDGGRGRWRRSFSSLDCGWGHSGAAGDRGNFGSRPAAECAAGATGDRGGACPRGFSQYTKFGGSARSDLDGRRGTTERDSEVESYAAPAAGRKVNV